MSILGDLTLQAILTRIVATLVFVAVSGGALTFFARILLRPDAEVRSDVSANPFTHLSLAGLAMAILFRITWMRFRVVAPEALRGGRLSVVVIVLVTLAAGLALVPLLDLLRPLAADRLPRTVGYAVLQGIDATQKIALSSVPLNLLPLPGLTGGLLLLALFPERKKQLLKMVVPVQAGLVILLILGWWPDFGAMLAPILMRG